MHNLIKNELRENVDFLVETCHDASRNAGWWHDLKLDIDLREEACRGSRFGKALVAEKLCLIHSEVSEAMEGHRKDMVDEKLPEFDAITVELADACIRIFDLAGAHFIKTSSGKIQPAATLPVTLIMLEAVRDYYATTGQMVGVKPAGGIRTAKDAIKYLVMVNETVGEAWLDPHWFRFGASTLLNDLLMQRTKMLTGRYSGPDYFTLD